MLDLTEFKTNHLSSYLHKLKTTVVFTLSPLLKFSLLGKCPYRSTRAEGIVIDEEHCEYWNVSLLHSQFILYSNISVINSIS